MPLWTLDEALILIKALQPETRNFDYHVALGGGVLNRGSSDKDLDLYFMPLSNRNAKPNAAKLVAFLEDVWGRGENLGGEGYDNVKDSHYEFKLKFYRNNSQRIDAFIMSKPDGESVCNQNVGNVVATTNYTYQT